MQASRLKVVWIMLQSALVTLYTCLRTIYAGATHKPRAWIDQGIRAWAQRMLNILSVTYQVHNPHHFAIQANERYIIMCSHSSLYDIPLSYAALPGCIRMLAKKELSHIPLFAAAMRAAEVPIINRQNRKQAIKDLQNVYQLIDSGVIIWIAPEGTRSATGELGPFKKGAFITAIQAKAKIIPIVMQGAHNILPAKTWDFHLQQHVDIHIGPLIDAGQYNEDNKDALMVAVRGVMEGLLQQPRA